MVQPKKCRFCPAILGSFRQLKHHCELEHNEEYTRVAMWVGKTVTPKIETYERLAAEGLIGFRERKDP